MVWFKQQKTRRNVLPSWRRWVLLFRLLSGPAGLHICENPVAKLRLKIETAWLMCDGALCRFSDSHYESRLSFLCMHTFWNATVNQRWSPSKVSLSLSSSLCLRLFLSVCLSVCLSLSLSLSLSLYLSLSLSIYLSFYLSIYLSRSRSHSRSHFLLLNTLENNHDESLFKDQFHWLSLNEKKLWKKIVGSDGDLIHGLRIRVPTLYFFPFR